MVQAQNAIDVLRRGADDGGCYMQRRCWPERSQSQSASKTEPTVLGEGFPQRWTLNGKANQSSLSAMDQPTEAEKVAALIAAEPWQEIVGPPVKKKTGGWLIPSKHVFATWPHDDIPHAHSIYVKREDGGFHVACIYDIHGKLHHR